MVNLWSALKSVVREAVGRSMVDVSEITAIGVDGTSSTLVSAEWMIPKILWLLENEPGNFEKKILFMEQVDWITFKLTGEFEIECQPHLPSVVLQPQGRWVAIKFL